MVLAAQNKGDYGATILNNKIQKAINPHTDGGLTVETNEVEVTYYCGDMVMNIVNDYDSIICNEVGEFETDDDNKPIFTTLIANGENGRIVYIVPDNDTQKRAPGMVIKYDDFYIWREKSSLNKIQLAYAESVHKSQGSGCDYVIIFTPRAHTYMLNSALLYVAVTRAKKCAFHIGNLSTVNGAIHKRPNLNRSTNLQELLRQEEETDDDSGN
jgi:ATP-dependent exoDNAse (exonuclease V) alpha subunit